MKKKFLTKKSTCGRQSGRVATLKTMFATVALALCTIGVPTGCSDDDYEVGKNVTQVNEKVGHVEYDDYLKKWYISTTVENQVDGDSMYFPNQMPEELRSKGTRVRFSGVARDMKVKYEVPVSYYYFYIILKNIEKL